MTEHIAFTLDQETFAWPAHCLKEILLNQRIIPVPAKTDNLYGVVNYKNQVLPILNLHHLLGLAVKERLETSILLITGDSSVKNAVLVDCLKGVLDIGENDVKPKPASLHSDAAKFISGEFYHHENMITLLNPERLMGRHNESG